MITQIDTDLYRIKVRKTLYKIGIIARNTPTGIQYGYTINRAYMYPFWRALALWYSRIREAAQEFSPDFVSMDWHWSLWFRNKETAEQFLYFVDRKYNPTPSEVEEFIDIKLWGGL